MTETVDSPAHLFRDVGRSWAKDRSARHRITDVRAAAETFATVLKEEKTLVHHVAHSLQGLHAECKALHDLDDLDRTDASQHWLSLEKIVSARVHACEQAVRYATYGEHFMQRWKNHFVKIIPERTPLGHHVDFLITFFAHAEHVFTQKREEYLLGHTFTALPSLATADEALAAIEEGLHTLVEALLAIERTLTTLEHDRKNEKLQQEVFDAIKTLAPLLYVTKNA